MNKDYRSNVYTYILLTLLFLLSSLGYYFGFIKDANLPEPVTVPIDDLPTVKSCVPIKYTNCEPFLKNTIYYYNPSDDLGMLSIVVIDSSYTPPIKRNIELITLELDLDKNIAIVYHEKYVKHKILQINYIRNHAEIKTDKGEIFVYKPNEVTENEYPIMIKYEKLLITPGPGLIRP